MKKFFGTTKRQDGIYRIADGLYDLFFGFHTEEDGGAWEWRQRFEGEPPTPREIKDIILDTINEETDRRILEGFSWRGLPVLFTEEQKFTHEAAYNLAKELNAAGVYQPIELKMSEDGERNDITYRFEDFAELQAYHTAAFLYQQKVYAEAAAERKDIDWSRYDTVIDLT